ncbi:hypothetical protein ABT58_12660 [Photobacterium aphoticum]|uniref:Uncharacterized protein n=1 Tax=Photobacterium aphoticum TaxID=754436 RepID=A0A0J1JFJ1_9GAMM|nr:hypothetical protein ABT58_12660 [Photobacterium aphoticum]
MLMMQTAINNVVDVIAMLHCFMSTIRAMYVTITLVFGVTLIRMIVINVDDMLVTVIAVWMMQYTINQVINMITMLNGSMSTVRTVLMVRVCMMRI